jgi:nicotinate-nucleotide adenylyltransferase
MRIGIYSGTFNPVHCGHVSLAEWLVRQDLVDEIWLIRSPRNPFKVNLQLLDDGERLEMLKLAVAGRKGLKISTVEDGLPIPNYTITTLRLLRKQYPEHEFHLIVGGDNWAAFDKWREWESILRDFHLIVYPRPGIPLEPDPSKFPTVRVAAGAPQWDLSSTEIRYRVMTGKSVAGWVPDAVADYIKEKELYR